MKFVNKKLTKKFITMGNKNKTLEMTDSSLESKNEVKQNAFEAFYHGIE